MMEITGERASEPPVLDDGMVLNSLPHPVIVVDDGGHISFTNASAEVLFGLSSHILKKSALDGIVPFDSAICALVRQVRERGASVSEYGIQFTAPRSRREQLVDIQATPIAEVAGAVLVMIQQRSTAHKIDRQLIHRGAARSIKGMASVLAHEIKNPLSGIRGAAQLLETAVDGDDRVLTRLICDETDRICGLVERMEGIGDSGTAEMEPVNVHSVLEHVKKIGASGFARNITIREEYDPSLPPVMGNRDQLVQVFLNLLKNAAEALKGSRKNPEITLTSAFRPGFRLSVPASNGSISLPLELCVCDNGPGIADGLLPHLFDPFVTTRMDGSGLGLALVARIINDHGGIVECVRRNKTTVFRVLLPMQTQKSDNKEQ